MSEPGFQDISTSSVDVAPYTILLTRFVQVALEQPVRARPR